MTRFLRLVTAVTVLVLIVCVLMFVYYVTDADCRARGGRTEIIYGGRGGGWTCSGGRP